jgi:hypothetical protein
MAVAVAVPEPSAKTRRLAPVRQAVTALTES